MKKLIHTALLTLVGTQVFAQTDTAKLNKYFSQLEKNNKAMASVCLYDKGTFIYDRAIGLADVEKNKKANVYTLYRIGSITKTFTAVMILQLIEEKKLALDTKLNTFYPTIKNSEKITVEQLLNHRSGIANFTSEENYMSYAEKPHTEEELIRIFEKLSSDFTPGSQFAYSNTNYVLLTFILQKVTKSTYADQLLKRICAKAKLADTRLGTKINTENNEAQSYNFENLKWVKSTETDMSVPLGAGAIVSTAKDLCLFIEAIFNYTLLKKETVEKMKTMTDGYGYGIMKFPFNDKKFYGHTGGIDGFESMLGYNEDDKVAMSIVGNGYDYSANNMAIALLSAYYKQPFDIPDFEKKEFTKAQAKGKEGTYTNDKIGMDITIFDQNGKLMAQATNQGAFELEKVSELEYKYEKAGIVIEFIKEKEGVISSLKLKQGGMNLLFTKK